ncbi:hypothetical protein AN958_11642 [Leucoagaricus sp. SymC.cos]|nr:hypothetical protein AN958_11642 [Leucoagaricus sp. SymC.cos]
MLREAAKEKGANPTLFGSGSAFLTRLLEYENNVRGRSPDDRIELPLAYLRIGNRWETFVSSLLQEWQTLNIVSALLVPGILTMFQISGATNDPVTRYLAFWSLISAIMSLLYGCIFIIQFSQMKRTTVGIEWATEALEDKEAWLWTVDVMLSLPAVWLAWLHGRCDPQRFFTTIAYQLAVKFDPYGDMIDAKIQRDPSILKLAMLHQLLRLIVKPIRELAQKGVEFPEKVIFIDGLDECKGADAQVQIIELVAESARDKTTPFLWFFFSRLEPRIVSTFNTPYIKSLTVQHELVISRELDPEISIFLADTMVEIRRRHGLPDSWPSGEDHLHLVELSSGFFAYAHLDIIIDMANRFEIESDEEHPLDALDHLYVQILKRIPTGRFRVIRTILLANHVLSRSARDKYEWLRAEPFTPAMACANFLGHSKQDFLYFCRSLHAVMEIDGKNNIVFYHASFMDFLEDLKRAEEFCIWLDSWTLLERAMQEINQVQEGRGTLPTLKIIWGDRFDTWSYFASLATIFLELLADIIDNDSLTGKMLNVVEDFDFRHMALFFDWDNQIVSHYRLTDLHQKLATQNIGLLAPYSRSSGNESYTIGYGNKMALLTQDTKSYLKIRPYYQHQYYWTKCKRVLRGLMRGEL